MAESNNDRKADFETVGRPTQTIDVQISHRIIKLFSEGLYSSPNKALEELVSNSFDAGAKHVNVILAPDLWDPAATIVVVDDGEGMDIERFRQHWIIGRSTRRSSSRVHGRKPIGKFGIGKLATYILCDSLTHVCKADGKFYAVSMDYRELGPREDESLDSEDKGVFSEKKIKLPLRELSEAGAATILHQWAEGKKPVNKALKLFGKEASSTWTVAIMSRLTEMGQKISRGRLKWMLRTSMPIQDEFKIYLDGNTIKPSKIDFPKIKKWVIGKDITELGKPSPSDFESTKDDSFPTNSVHHWGLSHELLGRITGYVELYEDEISGGKSESFGRSNGFFVYVRGRMINTEDPGFGIERNLLRHGTFSRFRMVVHIDSLDKLLRSSRESLLQGDLYNLAKNFLHAAFNHARNRLEEHDQSRSPGRMLSARISSAPGSLTRKPLLALAERAVKGEITPFYTRIPQGLKKIQIDEFLVKIKNRAETEEGLLTSSELTILDSKEAVVVFDIDSGKLHLNLSHPFVASFQDELTNPKSRVPLEILLVSEALHEAHLYFIGHDETQIREIVARRDELFRLLVRSSVKRNSAMISMALQDAKDDSNALEEELRASFEALGFENVIRMGGPGKPDGTAEARLPASESGEKQRYKVGLEAKSGGIVTAHRLDVSAIASHMKKYDCDHHLVAANGFQTSQKGEDSRTVKAIQAVKDRENRTITLIHIDDLARLVRLAPAKHIGLPRLRNLFLNCITPEESKKWIDEIAGEKPKILPYKEILETVWFLGNKNPSEAVEYAEVRNELTHRYPVVEISKLDLIAYCEELQVMARGLVFAREKTVELTRRPDLILEDIRDMFSKYPDEEQETIKI